MRPTGRTARAGRRNRDARRFAAFVDEGASIGTEVSMGAGVVVHAGVEVGAHGRIGEHCVLGVGEPSLGTLSIGPDATIRSHSVVYRGSRLGAGLETGHHTVIRERTVAGEGLRVGNFSDIEGDCAIGDYCRFHGYVHVGKGSRIGNFVWIFSLAILTNDPLPPSDVRMPVVVEDGAVICVGAVLMPGVVVGKGALVAAGARVTRNVPPGQVVAGPEGKIVGHVSALMLPESAIRHPWMRHYGHHYPASATPRLERLLDEILESRRAFLPGEA